MAGMKTLLLRRPAAPGNAGARLGWEARRIARRAGPAALLGACALLLAGFAAWQAQALGTRQRALQAEIAAAHAAPAPAVARPADPARRIAAFYAYLPAHGAIPDLLKRLVEVAEQNGITLEKADYKPLLDDNAAFLRYQITLPIKAEYAKVQAFIVAALQALPTLTLENVAFKREQIESGDVEARLQFVLLVRKPLAKGAAR